MCLRHVALLSVLGKLIMQSINSFEECRFRFTARVQHHSFQRTTIKQLMLHQFLCCAQITLVNAFDEQAGQQGHRLPNRYITWNDVLHPPVRTFTVFFSERLGSSMFRIRSSGGENASPGTLPRTPRTKTGAGFMREILMRCLCTSQ